MPSPKGHLQAGRHAAINFNYPALSLSVGAPQAAINISAVAVTNNVATMLFAATGALSNGQNLYFSGLTNTTSLNAITATSITVVNSTAITFSFTHANIANTADTGTAAVYQTVTVQNPTVVLADGTSYNVVNANCPLLIGIGSVAETIPTTAISSANATAGTITLAPQNAHQIGDLVVSATYGLQESLNASNGSVTGASLTYVSQEWTVAGGTTAMLSNATYATGVVCEDLRNNVQFQIWNGQPSQPFQIGAVQVVAVTLNSTQLKAINATPVQLVPAQGASYVAVPLSFVADFVFSNATFTDTSCTGIIAYTNATTDTYGSIPQALMVSAANSCITVAATSLSNIVTSANLANKSIQLTDLGANYANAAALGSLTVSCYYVVQKIS